MPCNSLRVSNSFARPYFNTQVSLNIDSEFHKIRLDVAAIGRAAYQLMEWNMFNMSNLSRLKELEKSAPAAVKAFWNFDKLVFEEGALSVQTKQLMAVAVALTTQCPYCIELHAKAAREAGASSEQFAETALVAAAVRAGGAITHSTHLMRD